MKSPLQPEKPNVDLANIIALLFGMFLGVVLLKFGNPCILEYMVECPTNALEWLINPWPVLFTFRLFGRLMYGLLETRLVLVLVLLLIGISLLRYLVVWRVFSVRLKFKPLHWPALLPLVWLGWQFVAATQTVSPELTHATLLHFTACVVCFYIGFFALVQVKSVRPFFVCLLLGLLMVIAIGWQQHFGGLEETRRYFYTYIYPQMPHVPAEYLAKISKDRIFSTLFYPNALAGVLLLLLPMALVTIWRICGWMTNPARSFLVGLVGVAGLACLVWSGSKGGWLLMLALGLMALLRLDFQRKWKLLVMAVALVLGLAGFALKFSGYFQKGATSVTARADYWQAAVRTAMAHPIFGTGPGTFAIPYKEIKRPESEMARLVHNDYLEQASDSGVVGFLAYTTFIGVALWVTYRKVRKQADWLRFAVWLGLLGWSLQGLMEFGLYIPALAWTVFALFGWLLADGNGFDTRVKVG